MDSTTNQNVLDKATPNPTHYIFDLPMPLPTEELYNLKLVKLILQTDIDTSENFTVPRGIVCAKSTFFKKTFHSDFKNAKTGEVEIKDSEPWVVKVFINWLYSGQIYYGDGKGPSLESKIHDPTTAAERPTGQKRKREEEDDSICRVSRRTANTRGRLRPGIDTPNSPGALETGSLITHDQEVWPHPSTDEPDEEDPTNPVTWPYDWLFKIYIFADEYDTANLRAQVLNLIQLKVLQTHPRVYKFPNKEQIKPVIDRLPSTSKLRRLVVDLWAKHVFSDALDQEKSKQADSLASLPSQFLAECLVAAKAHMITYKSPGLTRGHAGYDIDDKFDVDTADPCYYHEHPKDGLEAERCSLVWRNLFREYYREE